MAALQSIGVVAEELGVTTRTLRYYEQVGLLQPTHRVGRGPRKYDAEARARLALIRRMQAAGLSLETIRLVLDLQNEIAQLGDEPVSVERLERVIRAVRTRHDEVRVQVRRLEEDLAQARAVEEHLARDLVICQQTLAERRAGVGNETSSTR